MVWGVLFFALLTLALGNLSSPKRLDVQVGDIAPRSVRAPRPVYNRILTDERRAAAAANVSPVYKRELAVLESAQQHVNWIFTEIRRVRGLTDVDAASRTQDLADRIRLSVLPPETYAALLTVDDALVDAAEAQALALLQTALGEDVYPRDVTRIKGGIESGAAPFTLDLGDPALTQFVRELVKSRIEANMVEDQEQTDWLMQRAAQEVPEVWWQPGELIIEADKPITQDQYEALVELGLVGQQASYFSWAGSALIALVVVGVMALSISRFRPELLERDSKLLLLGLIGFITLFLSLAMSLFSVQLGDGAAYLMPVALNAVLAAILLDSRVALLQSVIIAVLLGLFTTATDVGGVAVAVLGSVAGVYAVARVESRNDLYRAGLVVGIVNALAILALYLLESAPLLDWGVWRDVALGAINGLLVAILATGALPFFETLFGIVTPLKLLELSNPNHPLLKRLMVEAPGSYHHTILVANLCEAAAEAIGADPVLARVGAYYHDIGKIKRPAFFVENQFGGENPHDKLPPSLSAMIITSHVKEGVELAREAGLPQEIIDFIPEHHGTTLVSYFYYMASKSGQSEYVLEEDFRYEGPKPRRRETAICMLADGCEASVRAMRQKSHLSHDQIEQQVRKIINDRLQQGQLDNCDLTLKDLDTIAKVFVKVLSGVHHARIDYPGQQKQAANAGQSQGQEGGSPAPGEAEEAVKHGDLDQQRTGESGPRA
ncbi:putative nucleotidyltransferase with HDIG domain [Symbiobacterium terraclitae]|uniref:Nucleotidyltransferase with HDIG domain n=1 Tax=Symbiobacterium terraclitae TaxID=557451 RepID=A0ABS4JS86_9FIRM|nr:putative nucleotidyltransferase with HDIG domain [Symbiobacterium terraclitae]